MSRRMSLPVVVNEPGAGHAPRVAVFGGVETLARQIEQEGPPPEFAETVRTGWWTTCLENLPSKERSRGKY